jgi:hypothetical protein
MSMGGDTTWVGKKPIRRIGGLSDALSIASDLGFAVAPPPSQVTSLVHFNLIRIGIASPVSSISLSIAYALGCMLLD